VAEKVSSEPPKEVLSLPKDKDPSPADQAPNPPRLGRDSGQPAIQTPSNARVALTDRPSYPVKEKAPSTTKSSLPKQAPNEKREGSKVEQAPSPLPSVTQKEEAPPKPIALEQEGGKDHLLVSEVLNHFNSGVAFYNQKEFPKAIQAYQKVIELDPTYVEAYNNLGIIYQTMGDAKSALGAYQKATEINPKYVKGYNNLGLLFLFEGRYEEAIEAFQKALAINANHIESHINLGILFKKKGQCENAIESYQRALAIDPLHRETHYNMALLYEQLENWELAITHYQQFIQLSSKSYPELVVRVQSHLNALVEAKKNKSP
jgi:tetratricopeptide (TPR) repeat protein